MRVGVVDALDGHLADVGAEELARELGGALRAEPVRVVTFSPSIRSSTSTRSVTYGRITCGHDELLVLRDEPRDQLGVVRLLLEVELAAEVRFELFRERRRAGAAAPSREWRSSSFAVERSSSRSSSTCSSIPGRRTLTTTSRPSSAALVHLRDRRGGERLGIDLANGSSPSSSAITGSISA